MLVSSLWLHELWGAPEGGPLPGDKLDELLTGLGLEVEGITRHGDDWANKVVVAEILSQEPVPESKKLTLVQLQDGQEQRQVVCGASNLPGVGGKIAFARQGAKLPCGLEIGVRTLKGVESEGMICSAAELDIGADDEGILVLPRSWEHGRTLSHYLPGIVDEVLEISVTPNRPDALGHIGIARDLAVKLGHALVKPPHWTQELPEDSSLVTNQAPARCGRYFAASLEEVEVRPSPLAVQLRLHRVGQRAINNAVDVSNYVLMECGQPLHVFDRARLQGEGVVVRMAADKETMTTLDGSTLELRCEDLVIADQQKAQALAGVMGGEDSMVEPGCERALLEAAWFQPAPLRASARHHGLHTDSSHRFERGVDHGDGLEFAFQRALKLLCEWSGAKATGYFVQEGERPPVPEIPFRPAQVERLLGMPIPAARCAELLEALEVQLQDREAAQWSCRPPTFRPDLHREVDLIEEVMRHHGLDAMPREHCRPSEVAAPRAKSKILQLADRLTQILSSEHYHECVNLVFGDAEHAHWGAKSPVRLKNPLRVQDNCLRGSLAPGLFQALALNAGRHARELRLFEIGRVYDWPQKGEAPVVVGDSMSRDPHLPSESLKAAWVRMGELRPLRGKPKTDDSIQALILDSRRLFARLGLRLQIMPASKPCDFLHPGVQAELRIEGDGPGDSPVVGFVGQLHPDRLDHFDLPSADRAAYAEIDLASLVDYLPPFLAQSPPRFPATSRDLSLLLPASLSVAECVQALRGCARELVPNPAPDELRLAPGDRSTHDIDVVEVYQDLAMAPGSRAVLFRIYYRAVERSIKDKEAQLLHQALLEKSLAKLATDGHKVELR